MGLGDLSTGLDPASIMMVELVGIVRTLPDRISLVATALAPAIVAFVAGRWLASAPRGLAPAIAWVALLPVWDDLLASLSERYATNETGLRVVQALKSRPDLGEPAFADDAIQVAARHPDVRARPVTPP